ncbi:MAG: MoaD/ThiS family protein [Candidatus Thorarchaeota archaeon]
MTVRVKFRGPLANNMEQPIIEVDAEGEMRLGGVLLRAIESHQQVREHWSEPEDIEREALVLLNGVDSALLGGLDATVRDGDTIEILPLVHGG